MAPKKIGAILNDYFDYYCLSCPKTLVFQVSFKSVNLFDIILLLKYDFYKLMSAEDTQVIS